MATNAKIAGLPQARRSAPVAPEPTPLLSCRSEIRRTGNCVTPVIEHAHRQIEFDLIIGGSGTYFVGTEEYHLKSGTLIWLMPGQSHRLFRGAGLDMWVCFIDPERLEGEILKDIADRPCRDLSVDDALALDRLLSEINQDTDEPLLYQAGVDYAFRSAWRFTMTTPGPVRKPVHPAVLKALAILRGNEDMPSGGDLAKQCGVAQSYLTQLLTEQTGRNLVDWRNVIRLERFQSTYSKSGDLLNAALDAGFGSYAQFHRVFMELVGMTPGQWAKGDRQAGRISSPEPISGTDAGSTRMAWYPLSEQPFLSARRGIPDRFAEIFEAADASVAETPPIDTGIAKLADLERFADVLINEMKTDHPQFSERLTRILSRHSFPTEYAETFDVFELGHSDFASIFALYLGFAYIIATGRPALTKLQLDRFLDRVRYACNEAQVFKGLSQDEKLHVTAAFMCQTIFLSAARNGALSSRSDELMERVSAAARSTALACTGLDVAQLTLE